MEFGIWKHLLGEGPIYVSSNNECSLKPRTKIHWWLLEIFVYRTTGLDAFIPFQCDKKYFKRWICENEGHVTPSLEVNESILNMLWLHLNQCAGACINVHW